MSGRRRTVSEKGSAYVPAPIHTRYVQSESIPASGSRWLVCANVGWRADCLFRGDLAVRDSVNITDFHFSTQFSQAIEQKQVAQQRAQQAQYELQKARVLADQKIVEAHAQAEAQKLLQQTITPEIIQQQAVAKWRWPLAGSTGE